ncbi:hypothetical protein HY768_03795 [candidate division TA06 bacterium]|uniref:Uncharacterized protein n=1 Tax=candidate division TA06 bacterium TaxID=2250710 RepID=A0A933I807_UNCT6|nr:hypothetical protein [candidate division TA06 bacterium]
MKWKITIAAVLLLLLFAVPGRAYIYRDGSLSRGQRIYIDIEINSAGNYQSLVYMGANGTLDADLYIYSPYGNKIFTMSGSSTGQPPRVTFTYSGTYRFEIVGYSGSGNYLLFLGDKNEWEQVASRQ